MTNMKRCPCCGRYTLKDYCPECGFKTVNAHPPSYSPQDRYGKYRRKEKFGSG